MDMKEVLRRAEYVERNDLMRLSGTLINPEEDVNNRRIYREAVSYSKLEFERNASEFFEFRIKDIVPFQLPKLFKSIVDFAKGSILDARQTVMFQRVMINHGASFKMMDDFWRDMGMPYESISFSNLMHPDLLLTNVIDEENIKYIKEKIASWNDIDLSNGKNISKNLAHFQGDFEAVLFRSESDISQYLLNGSYSFGRLIRSAIEFKDYLFKSDKNIILIRDLLEDNIKQNKPNDDYVNILNELNNKVSHLNKLEQVLLSGKPIICALDINDFEDEYSYDFARKNIELSYSRNGDSSFNSLVSILVSMDKLDSVSADVVMYYLLKNFSFTDKDPYFPRSRRNDIFHNMCRVMVFYAFSGREFEEIIGYGLSDRSRDFSKDFLKYCSTECKFKKITYFYKRYIMENRL